MKNLAFLVSLIAVSLGFSSCCSMFGISSQGAGYRTETRQVKTCYYDVVQEEVLVQDGSKGGMMQTVEKRVPRFKTVTKQVRIPCGPCVRLYCPSKDCCGTTSEYTMRLATMQGGSGSPNLGLIPTMRVLPLTQSVTAP